jgi:WD40 repeat protein
MKGCITMSTLLFPSHVCSLSWVHARQIVAGCADGKLYLRDLDEESGAPARIVGSHSDEILAVDASPDGKRVASGGRDGMLKIWDLRSGTLILGQGFDEPVSKVLYNRKGDRLLAVVGKKVWVWSVRKSRGCVPYQHTFLHPVPVVDAVWSPEMDGDGTYLASITSNGTYFMWDGDRHTGIFKGSASSEPISMAWLPAGIYIGTRDGRVTVYTASTGRKMVACMDLGRPVTALAWVPGLKESIAAATTESVQVVTVAEQKVPPCLDQPHRNGEALALDRDGRQLATVSRNRLSVYAVHAPTGKGEGVRC